MFFRKIWVVTYLNVTALRLHCWQYASLESLLSFLLIPLYDEQAGLNKWELCSASWKLCGRCCSMTFHQRGGGKKNWEKKNYLDQAVVKLPLRFLSKMMKKVTSFYKHTHIKTRVQKPSLFMTLTAEKPYLRGCTCLYSPYREVAPYALLIAWSVEELLVETLDAWEEPELWFLRKRRNTSLFGL